MKPAFSIKVNGVTKTHLINDRLISLEIVDKAGLESDSLTLTLDDRDQKLIIPSKGAKMEIWLGYDPDGLTKMGVYTVNEVSCTGGSAGREMHIRANAADMGSSVKEHREKSWTETTFGKICSSIASSNGLTVSISPDLAKMQVAHLDQSESDMNLLSRMCAQRNAIMKVSESHVIIARRGANVTQSGKSIPIQSIDGTQVSDWTCTFSDRKSYGSVKAHYTDISGGGRSTVTAGEGKPSTTLRHTYSNEAEAQAAAQSKLAEGGRDGAKLSIQGLIGNPLLQAETVFNASGFRAGVDGPSWLLNEIKHTYNGSGYFCDIEAESKS